MHHGDSLSIVMPGDGQGFPGGPREFCTDFRHGYRASRRLASKGVERDLSAGGFQLRNNPIAKPLDGLGAGRPLAEGGGAMCQLKGGGTLKARRGGGSCVGLPREWAKCEYEAGVS